MHNYERSPLYDKELESRYKFWEYVDSTLQIRDTETLKMHVIDKASDLQLDAGKVKQAIAFMEAAHDGQKRDFTGDPYIVHTLQVTLIGLALMDQDKITTDDVSILLNHDTLEDTKTTYQMLETTFGKNVADGVVGLSHSINGGKRLDTQSYFDHISETDRRNPDLKVLPKKVADLLVNGNDPINASGLKDPLSTFFVWEKTTKNKVSQMNLFLDMLKKDRPEEKGLMQTLHEGMIYTQMSKEPTFKTPQLKNKLATMKN